MVVLSSSAIEGTSFLSPLSHLSHLKEEKLITLSFIISEWELWFPKAVSNESIHSWSKIMFFFKPKFGRRLGRGFFLVGFIPKSILGGARCCQVSTHSSQTNLNPKWYLRKAGREVFLSSWKLRRIYVSRSELTYGGNCPGRISPPTL